MLLTVNSLLSSNTLLGNWVKEFYLLTRKELLNIAGIASIKYRKNCRSDGILVNVENLWIEMKIQPNL